MERVEFIKQYLPLVTELGKSTGIFPEIFFSQAFAEGTGKVNGQYVFGESPTMKNANNIFNIRPAGKPNEFWHGDTYDNPYVTTESKTFRKYDSLDDSIKDYFNFLVNNSRYRAAGVFSAPTWQAQAEALDAAHYAGASNGTYATLLKNIGKNLTSTFDKLRGSVTAETKAAEAEIKSGAQAGESFLQKHGVAVGLTLFAVGAGYYFTTLKSENVSTQPKQLERQ